MLNLLILNKNKEIKSNIDEYESIIWNDKYNQYGDFELYLKVDLDILSKLPQDYYVISDISEHAMIIEKHETTTDVEKGNMLKVTGRSLESILERRIVWDKITLDGYLEGQIEKLLEKNIINPDDPNRKIENFIFRASNSEIISKIKINNQFTGDNIYEIVKKICQTFNIGFKIFFDENFNFVFQLYAGEDRSYNQEKNPFILFAPSNDNLINSDYINDKTQYKNVALVAGEGEDADRKTAVVGDEEVSDLDRRELYVDARDLSTTDDTGAKIPIETYNSKLKDRGNEKLSDNKILNQYDGKVEPIEMYEYGIDYGMGDICQMENNFGMDAVVRVIEFIYSENSSGGVESYPTFSVVDDEEEGSEN